MQMYDVSLAELTQSGDVSACVGNVNLIQMMLAEMKMEEHDKSLPNEAPLSPRGLRQSYYGDVVRKLVADKHLGFHRCCSTRPKVCWRQQLPRLFSHLY